MFKKILLIIALLVLSLIAGGAYYLYIASAPAKEEKIVFDMTPVTQEVAPPTAVLPTTESGTTAISGDIMPPPRVKKYFAQFVPTFREVDLPFVHRYDKRGLPALGSSLIDVDGDGVEEVFIGGGYGQSDGLFYFKDGKFEDRIATSGLSGDATTYGSFVVDSDSDGDSDILISREDGIYSYKNDGTGKFSEKKLAITLEKNSVVLSIAGGDIDRDGVLDLYLSTFIDAANLRTATFNDSVHAKANILLRGKGDDIYEDITKKAGAVFDQNTFISSLVDLDSDGYPDIVIAPNTEKITIYKNNGNLTFTRLPPVTGYGFWMGLALGDIDNDKDIDIFVSNMGNTIPVKSARGDLRADQVLDPEWRLIENLGNMQFQDATEKSGLLGYEFAWGAIFEDWNLDSHLDLIVAENYIKWPPHKITKLAGRFFIGGADGKFRPTTTESRAENYAYGTTPLSSDFDADGYPDLIITNLDGKTKALLSDGGANTSLRVIVPTSARYIGATLTMMSVGGTEITRAYTPAAGLYSSQSSHIIFPFAPGDSVESLSVSLTTDEEKLYDKAVLDTMLDEKRYLKLPIF